MRARNAARMGLSLTCELRAAEHASPDLSEYARARQVAWGALLVSAAAIAGYLAGPLFPTSPAPAPHAGVAITEGDGKDAARDRQESLIPE